MKTFCYNVPGKEMGAAPKYLMFERAEKSQRLEDRIHLRVLQICCAPEIITPAAVSI
jgi:hypothetical protein